MMNNKILAYAAWHPKKGFDRHQEIGPVAYADIANDGVLEHVDEMNHDEGTNRKIGWRETNLREVPWLSYPLRER